MVERVNNTQAAGYSKTSDGCGGAVTKVTVRVTLQGFSILIIWMRFVD